MKTVIIPNDYHPFVIEVNGVKYTYPEGTEQSVPDEVASAIHNYYKLQPREGDPNPVPFGVDADGKEEYKSKYTGAEIDAAVAKAGDATKVTANPTLAGTESALTGLEVGTTKYKVEQPINVVANPTLAGTEAALEGLQVGDTNYKVSGDNTFLVTVDVGDGTTVTANKTYAEITAAQAAGKQVIFKIYIDFFGTDVTGYTNSYLFGATGVSLTFVFYLMNGVKASVIQLNASDGTWSCSQKNITTS